MAQSSLESLGVVRELGLLDPSGDSLHLLFDCLVGDLIPFWVEPIVQVVRTVDLTQQRLEESFLGPLLVDLIGMLVLTELIRLSFDVDLARVSILEALPMEYGHR